MGSTTVAVERAALAGSPVLAEGIGDPSEILMIPEHRWTCDYRFWSPDDSFYDQGNYVTIIAREDAVANTRLDGPVIPASEWTEAPSPGPLRYFYVVKQVRGPNEHVVTGFLLNFDPAPVTVYAHGYRGVYPPGRSGSSYGYTAGMATGQ